MHDFFTYSKYNVQREMFKKVQKKISLQLREEQEQRFIMGNEYCKRGTQSVTLRKKKPFRSEVLKTMQRCKGL